MPKKTQQAVAKIDNYSDHLNLNQLSWDDLRIFLACAEEQSFRQAAVRLNKSPATVSRRIDRLEHTLGVTLFNRLPDGITLTPQAQSIKDSALQMERSIFDVIRSKDMASEANSGSVTIAVTEGIGTFWLTPHLVALNKQYPEIEVTLQCQMKTADIARMEADMAIQFVRPTNEDLIMAKVGTFQAYLFASKGYIEANGVPKGLDELKNHRWVKQITAQLRDEIWLDKLAIGSFDELPGMTTTTQTTAYNAIAKSLGMGVLPTYINALGADLVPVDMGLFHSYDMWLTYHPSVRETPHKKIVTRWLRSVFDDRKYPWFGDEFIHPDKLEKIIF